MEKMRQVNNAYWLFIRYRSGEKDTVPITEAEYDRLNVSISVRQDRGVYAFQKEYISIKEPTFRVACRDNSRSYTYMKETKNPGCESVFIETPDGEYFVTVPSEWASHKVFVKRPKTQMDIECATYNRDNPLEWPDVYDNPLS
jgi:hypothetical protein